MMKSRLPLSLDPQSETGSDLSLDFPLPQNAKPRRIGAWG